jgi:hypothetical protein
MKIQQHKFIQGIHLINEIYIYVYDYFRLLTNGLVKVIESRGGNVVIGKANGFLFETITTHTEKDEHHQTSPIRATKLLIEDQDPIEADVFILAMGPWTCK